MLAQIHLCRRRYLAMYDGSLPICDLPCLYISQLTSEMLSYLMVTHYSGKKTYTWVLCETFHNCIVYGCSLLNVFKPHQTRV